MRAPPTGRDRRTPSPFHVPAPLHLLGGLVHRHPRVWTWLGRVESSRLGDELQTVAVRRPIFICGLARAGSTLLHQVVGTLPGVATHRAKDYPMVFTPFWWRKVTIGRNAGQPSERSHRDGVLVTPDSPDALEEMVWMAFFPDCHDPGVNACLERETRHPEFETFYDRHLRKLLLAEGATRYAAKNNALVARLPYLLRLYPDARIVIPVREPAAHVASLRHQHAWFSAGHRSHPRSLAYMRRTGHFEFGLDRRPIHLGDPGAVRRVADAWAAGNDVRGLAILWASVYRHLAHAIATDPQVRSASVIVRYEDLLASPVSALARVLEHCDLAHDRPAAAHPGPIIRPPTTAPSSLSADELACVRDETASAAAQCGYA